MTGERLDQFRRVRELGWTIGAGDVAELVGEIDRLRCELAGERKAKETALAGLASVTELYDVQKHDLRALAARIERLATALAAERERCAKICDAAARRNWRGGDADTAPEHLAAAIRRGG